MLAIIRKELADYFNSVRFLVLFLLVLIAAVSGFTPSTRVSAPPLEQSQAVTNGGFVFLALFTSSFREYSLMTLAIAIIIPIVGIALGFDAINSERTGGTLSRLLSQPVYRDSVINGKFVAGNYHHDDHDRDYFAAGSRLRAADDRRAADGRGDHPALSSTWS